MVVNFRYIWCNHVTIISMSQLPYLLYWFDSNYFNNLKARTKLRELAVPYNEDVAFVMLFKPLDATGNTFGFGLQLLVHHHRIAFLHSAVPFRLSPSCYSMASYSRCRMQCMPVTSVRSFARHWTRWLECAARGHVKSWRGVGLAHIVSEQMVGPILEAGNCASVAKIAIFMSELAPARV